VIKSAIVVVFFLLENDERAQSLSLTFRNKRYRKSGGSSISKRTKRSTEDFLRVEYNLIRADYTKEHFLLLFLYVFQSRVTFIQIALSFVIPFVFIDSA